MKKLSVLVLVLALAGCASSVSLVQETPPQVSALPDQVIDEPSPQPAPPKIAPRKPTRASNATALKTELHEEKSSGLMDCDDACKKNCSPKNQSRPKWCVLYQEPK